MSNFSIFPWLNNGRDHETNLTSDDVYEKFEIYTITLC